MNLMVNSLPTKTWNHLHMNSSLVSLEGALKNHSPRAVWDEHEIMWNPDASCPDAVGELEPLMENSGVCCAETAENVQMSTPLVLRYDLTADEQAADKLVLHAKQGSTLQVVLQLSSPDGPNTLALQTVAHADEGAKIELYVAELMGQGSTCLYNLAGTCADEANITLTRLDLGAGRLYAGANVDLLGRDSSFNTEIGYHGKPGQLLDMNYVANHHGKNTTSLMEINGTLEEGSKKIFRGTIDFRRGCAGAKGTENENVLLMGDDMVNQTIPLILCQEEDVEGNHGASIGQLDDRVLFYLGSRGMEPEEARLLIARSRIEAICAEFPAQDVQEAVHAFENQRGMFHGEEL